MHAGVVAVWSGGEPLARPFRIPPDGLVLGRELLDPPDERMSVEHGRIAVAGDQLEIEDWASKNGTFVAGERIEGRSRIAPGDCVRTGRTMWVVVHDIRPFETYGVLDHGGIITGALTHELRAEIARAALAGKRVVIEGESGSGRGHLLRAYGEWCPAGTSPVLEEDISRFRGEKLGELLVELERDPGPRAFTINVIAAAIAPELEAVLRATATWVTLPPLRARPDELARIVREAGRSVAPQLACHATLFEECWRRSRELGLLVIDLRQAARRLVELGQDRLDGRTFVESVKSRWALQGN